VRRKGLGLVMIAVLACAFVLGCSAQKGEAKTRVETVLKGLSMDENSSGYLLALCQWYAARDSIRADDLEVAQDHLVKWLGAKSLRLPLRDHVVKGVELRDGPSGREAVVSVVIDGHPLAIRVVGDETLEWAE
jgi:hypothetical protein